MENTSCFFTGHRETSSDILDKLTSVIKTLITESGVSDFVVGQYGNFDRLAAQAVKSLKPSYPDITLTLLLPYYPANRPVKLPEGFDFSYHPPNMETVPRRYAIVRANRYLIEHCDYLIAYAWHPASNARELVEYAVRKGVNVYLLERSSG